MLFMLFASSDTSSVTVTPEIWVFGGILCACKNSTDFLHANTALIWGIASQMRARKPTERYPCGSTDDMMEGASTEGQMMENGEMLSSMKQANDMQGFGTGSASIVLH